MSIADQGSSTGQNDVEMRDKRIVFEVRYRGLKSDNQPFRTRGRIQPAIGLVFGFASEIELGYQTIEPRLNSECGRMSPAAVGYRAGLIVRKLYRPNASVTRRGKPLKLGSSGAGFASLG